MYQQFVRYSMIVPAINHLAQDFLASHLYIPLLEANSQSPCRNLHCQESQAANNSQVEPPREWPAQTTLLACRASL